MFNTATAVGSAGAGAAAAGVAQSKFSPSKSEQSPHHQLNQHHLHTQDLQHREHKPHSHTLQCQKHPVHPKHQQQLQQHQQHSKHSKPQNTQEQQHQPPLSLHKQPQTQKHTKKQIQTQSQSPSPSQPKSHIQPQPQPQIQIQSQSQSQTKSQQQQQQQQQQQTQQQQQQQAHQQNQRQPGTVSPRRQISPTSTAPPPQPKAHTSSQSASSVQQDHTQKVVVVSVIQVSCNADLEVNCRRAEERIRDAARQGANIILLPGLFATLYFPIDQIDSKRFSVSVDDGQSYITRFQSLARDLGVVLPISFYELSNNACFNSVVIIDADGSQVGVYRKFHIPNGPGCQQTFHFSPGDTGFRIFKTQYATLGVGIGYDQWFPEAARIMALSGAELFFYPTAIGSEPDDHSFDRCHQWQRCMQGHSAANMVPVIAANRIGRELATSSELEISFNGSSFMTDHTGAIVSNAGRHEEVILTHLYNLHEMRIARYRSGLFRDRRPEMYTLISSFGVQVPHLVTSAHHASQSRFLSPSVDVTLRRLSTAELAAVMSAANSNAIISLHTGFQDQSPPTWNADEAASVTEDVARMSAMPDREMATDVGVVTGTPSKTPTPAILAALPSGAKQLEADPLVETQSRLRTPTSLGPPPAILVEGLGETAVAVAAQRRGVENEFALHAPSFIGKPSGVRKRRPRGRCWVCRSKTTLECKLCVPGPVVLCHGMGRECWRQFHAGETRPYPLNIQRSRRRSIEHVSIPTAAAVRPEAVASATMTAASGIVTTSRAGDMAMETLPAATMSAAATPGATHVSVAPDEDVEHNLDEKSDDFSDYETQEEDSDDPVIGSLLE